jgi:hypothetical protein
MAKGNARSGTELRLLSHHLRHRIHFDHFAPKWDEVYTETDFRDGAPPFPPPPPHLSQGAWFLSTRTPIANSKSWTWLSSTEPSLSLVSTGEAPIPPRSRPRWRSLGSRSCSKWRAFAPVSTSIAISSSSRSDISPRRSWSPCRPRDFLTSTHLPPGSTLNCCPSRSGHSPSPSFLLLTARPQNRLIPRGHVSPAE